MSKALHFEPDDDIVSIVKKGIEKLKADLSTELRAKIAEIWLTLNPINADYRHHKQLQEAEKIKKLKADLRDTFDLT